jgi:hypothetical protein
MNGGKKKKRIPASGYPNERISQKLKLILGNPRLLRDAGILREELKKSSVGKMVEEAINVDASFSASVHKQMALNKPLLDRALLSKYLAKSKIEDDSMVRNAALVLAAKYDLRPLGAWAQSLVSLILYGHCNPPSFDSLSSLTSLLNRANPKVRDEVFDAISELRKQNFGMTAIRDRYTGNLSIFIELFQNTSKNDIVAGWGAIKKIKDLALGKRNFYPLKNLDLANKISSLDESKKSVSDTEKMEEIFGEAGGANFGKIEEKRKRKIKQTRSRYKKRFGTKS